MHTPTLPPGITITEAVTPEQLADAALLFREYEHAIGIDLCFQNFEQELSSLPGKYAPPAGGLFLARNAGELLGCVAVRPLEPPALAELKRLYVRPAARGTGLGKSLTLTALNRAQAAGYTTIRLDTLSTMHQARALYTSLGFKEIDAYTYNPITTAVYMELDLG